MSEFFSLSLQRSLSEYRNTDEVPIVLNYYYGGKKIRLSSGIKVRIKDWNENSSQREKGVYVKKTDPNHDGKNLVLRQMMSKLEEVKIEISLTKSLPTTPLVKSFFKKERKEKKINSFSNVEFLFVIEEFIRKRLVDVKLREGTKRTLKTNVLRIQEYTREYQRKEGVVVTIPTLDKEFQDGLLTYLDDRGENPSTIRKRFSVLRSIVNWSREEGYSDITIKLIELPNEVKKKVIYLTKDEVFKLFNFKDFEFEHPKHHIYTNTYITEKSKSGKDIIRTNFEVYRDMLVFGCGVGTRYSDLVNLKIDNYRGSEGKYSNNELGFFQFRMFKSRESKEVVVPMNELTLQIYRKYSKNKKSSDYLFPRTRYGTPIYSEKLNVNIKIIGEIIGLNRLVSRPVGDVKGRVVGDSDVRKPLYKFLTTHIMRRTFIRESLNSQIPDYVVRQFSGHSSSKVFETYFNPTEKEMGLGHKIFSNSPNELVSGKVNETTIESLLSLYESGVLTKEEYLNKLLNLK